MDMLLPVAITTGILPEVWGWVAVSLDLLNRADFLGYTAHFTYPQGGSKGLRISTCTLLDGVVWALVIISGNMSALHVGIIGYVMIGIVAFLMRIQAKQWLFSLVPGTFIGVCATSAGQGDRRLAVLSLALGLVFDHMVESSGLWPASRRESRVSLTLISK